MFDDDDVDRAGHFPDFGNRALGFRRTHAAGRFIEQQQLWFGDKRHSNLEKCNISIRQHASRAVCQRGEADLFERLCDSLACGAVALGIAKRVEKAFRARVCNPEILSDAQAWKYAFDLKGSLDAEPADLVGRQAGDVATTENDLTGIRPQQA